MKRTRYIVFGLLFISSWLLFVTSCKIGKEYVRPELGLPDKIEVLSTDSLTIADVNWWELYTDTVLQNLIQEALENNKDIQLSIARLKQYMAAKRIADADMFPQIEAEIYGEKEGENPGGNNKVLSQEFEVNASLSWELDLWGNIRWGKEAALADYLATNEARRAVQLSIIADVADVYFTLIALDDELRIVKQTMQLRQEGVRLADLRFQGGLTSETSVQQARVELAKTMTLVPDLEKRIQIAQNQLALLLGKYETNINRGKSLAEQDIPAKLPTGLPSELLKRRPDIREAEQNLVAANAMVGMATTNRFPRLALTGEYGFVHEDLSELLKSPFWTVAGDILTPLFAAGKLKNRQRVAEAQYEQEIYRYQRTVLQAFQEANNAIVTFRKRKDVYKAIATLERATREYQKLAGLQYLNGVIGYLDLLDAQRNLFDAEIQLNNARRDELKSLVLLYKSLGGGWTE
ncbi:efflux transporter outer membrane subunit [Prolixibacteraceae bacterium Z1-6]|uniref:Efflux transporter outer membrane subunit n=1 Tax=Draconibacterium aestuarii TaxID=2998507 RepID=A0A9X3F6R2_9BACT|nr:efflux transporter outer membrane subunit [Prolixibacteraceae bacterium Z1-6]